MVHELGHVYFWQENINYYGADEKYERLTTTKWGEAMSASEVFAVQFENKYRTEQGMDLRTHYGGILVFNKKYDYEKNKIVDLKGKDQIDFNKYKLQSDFNSSDRSWFLKNIEQSIDPFIIRGRVAHQTNYYKAKSGREGRGTMERIKF